MTQIIDITYTLNPDIAVWPGDTPFRLTSLLKLAEGASVNLTSLTMSSHTGTHADAPSHFKEGAATIDQVALTPYWGRVQVVTVEKWCGPLVPRDFEGVDMQIAPRLLVRSLRTAHDPTLFPTDIVHPTPELADWLGEQGIILYGADAPSMDAIDSQDLPGHHALLRNGIAILEGLKLWDVENGVYELSALPLKVATGDGTAVRAALKTLGS